MKNGLFDDLKGLKKDMVLSEKEENEKEEKALIKKKEDKLKVNFEDFMKEAGIKKV